jgi:hypothetical protein
MLHNFLVYLPAEAFFRYVKLSQRSSVVLGNSTNSKMKNLKAHCSEIPATSGYKSKLDLESSATIDEMDS